MTALFISAFVLGLIFNVSPGAVFAETLRRGLRGGYYSALHVQFGSLVGDATWAILGLLGAGILFQMPLIRTPLALLGAAYLTYIAVQCFRSRTYTVDSRSSAKLDNRSALASGASLSLTNPANVFYWAALGGVLGGLGIAEPTALHYLTFLGGFLTSSVAWCFVCAGIIHALHRAMSPRIVKMMDAICGVSLLYLASLTIFDALQKHM